MKMFISKIDWNHVFIPISLSEWTFSNLLLFFEHYDDSIQFISNGINQNFAERKTNGKKLNFKRMKIVVHCDK